MEWTFTFQTQCRRECDDNKYIIVVEEQDSYSKALDKAVKQLPLGEPDNIYSPLGDTWGLWKVSVETDEIEGYANDKPEGN
tara:strand:+ start:422 stop:664 length:243 start_codon:yes stop_codon:yes gene_type:complete